MHVNTKPGYTRADWFFRAMRVDYLHDHLFSLTDIAEHDRRKKLLSPGVCLSSVYFNYATLN